jgi:hypothetical protein
MRSQNGSSATIDPATILRGFFLPLVFLFACQRSTVPEDSDPDAGNLKIVASYYAGESLWVDWKHTITDDGKVVEEIFDYGGHWTKTKKQTMLSKEDLTEIMAKVKEAEFHGLRKRYLTKGSDHSRLTLAITENKKTKQVSVDAPGWLEEDKEVKRFYRLWAEILRKVPAPNGEQKAELYER